MSSGTRWKVGNVWVEQYGGLFLMTPLVPEAEGDVKALHDLIRCAQAEERHRIAEGFKAHGDDHTAWTVLDSDLYE